MSFDLTPATTVAVAAEALLVVFALSFDMLRSWRTVAVWAASTGIVLVFGMRPGLALIQATAIGVFAVLVLVRNQLLWAMRIRDWRFVEAYRGMRSEIEALPPAKDIGLEKFGQDWEAIVAKFERTPAPDRDWLLLRTDTVAELLSRRAKIGDPAAINVDWVGDSRRRWTELQKTFDRTVKEHMDFWLVSPWS